ncbi:MAG: carboxypeptidase regulatory-like domain-containing protein, partial [Myxococcota bacterium]
MGLGPRVGMAALLLVATPCMMAAYTSVTTRWPGHVKGAIKLVGTPPSPSAFLVGVDNAACGSSVPDDSLVITKSGQVQGAVVYVEEISQGKEPPRRTANLEVRKCQLQPHVMTLTSGEELSLGTSDAIFHNLRGSYLGPDAVMPGRSLFNLALPPGSQRARIKFREPGITLITGQLGHDWMRAVIRVFDHPYHTVSGGEGTYELRDLPAGTYRIHVWHERLGEAVREVTVRAGYVERVDLELPVEGLRNPPWGMPAAAPVEATPVSPTPAKAVTPAPNTPAP